MAAKYEPIEVAIVEAIDTATQSEFFTLAKILRRAEIKTNFEAIIKSWTARAARLGYGVNLMGVLDSLLEQQKAQAAAASASSGERKSHSAGAIMP